MDLEQHLLRQMAFSRATFGPGARTQGVVDHIRKELDEVLMSQSSPERADEWVDVVILGLDGLTRELTFGCNGCATSEDVVRVAAARIRKKQGKNEKRAWPDWRTADPDKAIEHERPDGAQTSAPVLSAGEHVIPRRDTDGKSSAEAARQPADVIIDCPDGIPVVLTRDRDNGRETIRITIAGGAKVEKIDYIPLADRDRAAAARKRLFEAGLLSKPARDDRLP